MTPEQKELQMLIGDLKSETETLSKFLDAQTTRMQTIKDRIDYQLRILHKKNDNLQIN